MILNHDPTYPLFPVFSFLGFLVCLIPLPWHIQAWNSGTCAYMIWTALSCLNSFVNSLVWKDHARNIAPVWCDISSKIIIGVSVGIPASVLCISRRLYTLTAVQTVSITPADKRRMVLVDLCIAVGIPVIVMILHYVVQGHRFDILGTVGCYPVVYNSIPAYFVYFMWPLVLGAASFVYSAFTLRFFWLRRAQFTSLFAANSSLTASRYLRLMLLAIMDMLCTVPLGIFTLYFGVKGVGLRPWVSWEDTHFNFGRVVEIQAILWRKDPNYLVSVELTRWLPVVCAFIFFGLFGFAVEAKKEYVRAFWAVATRLGFKRQPSEKPKGPLPSWVKPLKSASSSSKGSTVIPQTSFSVPRKAPPTFTSSVSTDIQLDSYSGHGDIESSAGRFSSSSTYPPTPPAYARSPPQHVPFDVSAYSPSEFPESPTASAESDSATLKGEPSPSDLKWKLSMQSFASRDRFYVDLVDRPFPISPPPFSTATAPMFHRPFSPPLPYPRTAPHPGAIEGPVSPDGIVVTIQTVSSISSELPRRHE